MDQRARTAERIVHEDISWPLLAKLVLLAVSVVLVVRVLDLLGDVLVTVVVATFLTIALDAVVHRLQRFGMSRGRAIVTVIGSIVLGAAVVAVGVTHLLVTQGARLVEQAPELVDDLLHTELGAWLVDSDVLSSDDLSAAAGALAELPGTVAGIASAVVGGAFGLVTLLFAVTFLLVGGGSAVRLLVRLFPGLAHGNGWRLVAATYVNVGQYVVGATLQATCAGLVLTVVLLVLGVPYALALGAFMFLMDFVPLVGATIGAVPAVAVALFGEGTGTGIVVLAFIVLYQQVENALIQPRIQGRVVQLPGVAVFFSVLVGGAMFGIVGALFAVPVASVLAIALQQFFVATGRDSIEPPRLFDEAGRPVLGAPGAAAAHARPGSAGSGSTASD
jgi:predicted PurR-regulated permease PerM